MQLKRIAFYIPTFGGGGIERNVVLIASEMARRGHSVAVIVDDDQGPNRILLDQAVEVKILLRGGNQSGANARGVKLRVRRAIKLRAVLKEWRADAVFARSEACPTIAVLSQIGNGRRCKTVISYHNPDVPDVRFSSKAELRFMPVLSRLAHAVFGVSGDIERQLVDSFGAPESKCSVIHNPVDLDWINDKKHDPLPRDFVTNNPYILSVGRLDYQKGYRYLIDAYALLAKDIREDLVILGEGYEEAELRLRINRAGLENRIHLAGYAPNPFPIFSAAKLFVLASYYEGFGNVLVEALACGTPIVATNCIGGPREILDHGKYGTLVPIKNSPALADAIRNTLLRPQRKEDSVARAKDFSLDKITDQYLDIIR